MRRSMRWRWNNERLDHAMEYHGRHAIEGAVRFLPAIPCGRIKAGIQADGMPRYAGETGKGVAEASWTKRKSS